MGGGPARGIPYHDLKRRCPLADLAGGAPERRGGSSVAEPCATPGTERTTRSRRLWSGYKTGSNHGGGAGQGRGRGGRVWGAADPAVPETSLAKPRTVPPATNLKGLTQDKRRYGFTHTPQRSHNAASETEPPWPLVAPPAHPSLKPPASQERPLPLDPASPATSSPHAPRPFPHTHSAASDPSSLPAAYLSIPADDAFGDRPVPPVAVRRREPRVRGSGRPESRPRQGGRARTNVHRLAPLDPDPVRRRGRVAPQGRGGRGRGRGRGPRNDTTY